MKELFDFILYLSSAIILGIVGSDLSIRFSEYLHKKKCPELYDDTNTISEAHICDCICFSPDNCKSIDDVVINLKNSNVDFHFSVDF